MASRTSSWPGSPPCRRLTVSTSLVTRCAAEPRRDRTARPPTTVILCSSRRSISGSA
ncbi:hypothetical protein [Amycolatopsis plumensis]|uniref:hypothetical protein n=1 Tax=Amycolatopsis plumensis TaxID=236508 RepID=UPI003613CEE6